MKKYIFILLLLTVTAKAQVYSINPSLDSLRVNALAKINSSTSGNMTDAKINFTINMCVGIVCDGFPAIEKVDTLVVNRASSGFAFNSDFLRVQSVFRIDQYGDEGEQEIWTPINYIPYDSLAIIFDTKRKNADDLGKDLDLLTAYSWGRMLYFTPKNYTPVGDPDSFIVYYYARDAMLVSGTDSTNIAPEYMDELMYLIMSELESIQEDYGASNFYFNRYQSFIGMPKPREIDLKK